MEREQKRVRSDEELRTLLGSFERVPRDVVYKLLLESGLSVPDVTRMCQLNTLWSRRICTDEFWDKLFIDRVLARRTNMTIEERGPYYQDLRFLQWKREREQGMTNNFAHMVQYTIYRRVQENPFVSSSLHKTGEQNTTVFIRVNQETGDRLEITFYVVMNHAPTDNEQQNQIRRFRTMVERYLETNIVSTGDYKVHERVAILQFGAQLDYDKYAKFLYTALLNGWVDNAWLEYVSCALCANPMPATLCADCNTPYCGQECANVHHEVHDVVCIGRRMGGRTNGRTTNL